MVLGNHEDRCGSTAARQYRGDNSTLVAAVGRRRHNSQLPQELSPAIKVVNTTTFDTIPAGPRGESLSSRVIDNLLDKSKVRVVNSSYESVFPFSTRLQ